MGLNIGRLIGWLLVAAGALRLALDVRGWALTGHWAPAALGQIWYALDRSSLNLVQAVVQRYIHPFLWNPVIVDILLCWAFAVAFVLGAAILFLCRKRPPRETAPEEPVSPPPS